MNGLKPLSLIFMGTPEIAGSALRAVSRAGYDIRAAVTQPDRRAGRGGRLSRCAVARVGDELGLLVLQPRRIQEIIPKLKELGAAAAAVMAFGQLLPQEALDLFPLGCINVHTSLLPQLRGSAPANGAILQGLAETGVTTMFMDAGLDTGDILFQKATPIGPQETAGGLLARLSVLGAELLVETLEALARGQAPRIPQDVALATHAPKLNKQDGLLDWGLSASELDRRVRGLDPWPGAFTLWEGKSLKLAAPTVVRPAPAGAPPGQVLPMRQGRDDLLWVACGQGALGVGFIQAPGKKMLPAWDYLRGARLAPGKRLGA